MKFCVRNFQIKIEREAKIQQIEGNRIKNLSILETEFVKKKFASFLSQLHLIIYP